MSNTILSSGDDTFVASPGGDDTIYGGAGNDLIDANSGNDIVFGNEGNDTLLTGNAEDTVVGGLGADLIDAGNSADLIITGASLSGGGIYDDGESDTIVGGDNQSDTAYVGLGDVADGGGNDGGGDWLYVPAGYTLTGGSETIGADTVPYDQIFTNGIDTTSIYARNWENIGTYTPSTSPNPCFATGTKIATVRGEVAVEDLRVGDLVVTAGGRGALQPIVWIGHSQVNIARHPTPDAVQPILIKAGALADGVPFRDLRVSPDHALFLDGQLVPAKLLVNGTTILREEWCPAVTYWHVELPAHAVLLAEGAAAESYLDDGNRKHFDNSAIASLFKDFASERASGVYDRTACYPVLRQGWALETIRARLVARAAKSARPAAAEGRRSA